MQKMDLTIYADGCCEPNPGAGGWAFVVYRDGIEVHSANGAEPDTTNNVMELTAALRALEWIAAHAHDVPVRLISDSQYVVNGCNDWRHSWKAKGWRRGGPNAKPQNSAIANLDLWKELDAALTVVPIKLEWVRGHVGILGNERADELANIGRAALFPATDLIRDQLAYQI